MGGVLHPEELLPYVPPAVARQLRALAAEHPGVAFQPLLCSTDMGDTKSSRVAQAFGQWIVRRAGGLADSDWMSFGWPAPAGDLWEGSYLDDLLVLLIAARETFGADAGPDLDELRRIRAAHAEAGTLLHEGKRVERAPRGVVWGADFDGVAGTVRGEMDSLLQLVLLSFGFAFAPVGWKTLSRLVSSWTHHLGLRRPAMALLGSLYDEFARRRDGGGGACWLRAEGIDELLAVALLSPMYVSDLRAPFLGELFASDATTSRGAVVRAPVSPEVEAFVWSRLPRRGGYVRLFPGEPSDGPLEELRCSMLDGAEVRDELLYEVLRAQEWLPVAALNILGGRAHWPSRGGRLPHGAETPRQASGQLGHPCVRVR